MKLSQIGSLALEVTSHCNIRCPQCSRIDFQGDLAEFIKLQHWDIKTILPNLQVEQMTQLSFVRIEGDNGDAIMHPDIVQIVEHFYNAPTRPRILILTNGSLRSTDWWKKFGQKFPDRLRVQFSIDGMADTHALYRVGADYAKTVDNVRAFIASGGDATRRCLIFAHNQHQLDEIKQASLDIGFGALQIKPGDLFRFQGESEWPVFVKGREIHRIKPISNFDIDFSPWEYNHSNKHFWRNSYRDLGLLCPEANSREIFITYQGHLIPCCIYHADMYFQRDFNLDYQRLVGDMNLMDLNQRTLKDIFEDPAYYGHRLESMLGSDNRLPKCQTVCGPQLDRKIIQIRERC
jgi:MoaA/NifB/PqqE/SkfB family radical SAM enzyme